MTSRTLGLLILVALLSPHRPAYAQGVTTGAITGVIVDAQGQMVPGASVTAIHQPSGTTYEAVSQGDGRFNLPGMRVGGPYKVTASLTGFSNEVKENVTVSLGTATDLEFKLKVATIAKRSPSWA